MPLPSDTRAFVQRWRQKGTEYKFEPLDECFDRFFTAFVLYNCLYNIVTDRERYEFRHDYDKAVKVVPKFLTADDLYRDQVVRREAAKLVSLIEHRTFYVREKVWDDLRISKLRTADSEQWEIGRAHV